MFKVCATMLLFGLGFLLVACAPDSSEPVESPDVDQLPADPAAPMEEQPMVNPDDNQDKDQVPAEPMNDQPPADPTEVPGEGQAPAAPTEDSSAEQPGEALSEVESEPVPGSDVQGPVKIAMEDLAGRLNVDVAEIELREARAVVWPDASLGCPQPGMAYKQVPEDGLLIRLHAGGEIYLYHSGGSREPFFCQKSSELLIDTSGKEDEFVPPPGFDE